MAIILNSEQQFLYDKIVSQNFSKILVLGAGGVGKSATLCAAISELARRGVKNIALCAPTHLARLNIHSKLDKDVQHLVETVTVASLLLKFGIQKEDGTTHFTSGKIDKINKYSLIALDECSMISEEDYMLFMTSKAKIIFLGDWAQLPPVMARSAQNKASNHATTGNLDVFTLTKQMRQKGIILAAAERNRQRAWFPDKSEAGESGESIIVHNNRNELVEAMIDNLLMDKRGYSATYHYRFITYKNCDVREIGKKIRDKALEHYFGFDAKNIPFIYRELIMMRENKGNIGYNGELVEIQSIKKDMRSTNYPWSSYELVVKGSLGEGIIRTIPPCQVPLMLEYIDKLQSKLRGEQIRNEKSNAERTLSEIKKIKSYWTQTQYSFSITAHKSQGSTIENVYLDTLSFARAPNRRALLYVGISRASHELHTIFVPETQQLSSKEANARYRAARSSYEEATGNSYLHVLRYLKVSTRTPQGKDIVAGYLESLVEDLKQ
jgi:ATP-dependent exoDNAse (exonuclease V) alpha subunit